MTAESETQTAATSPAPDFSFGKFVGNGGKGMQALFDFQVEFLDGLREMNGKWLDRARTEASSATDFASRFMASHSISEAMTIWQDWNTHRLQTMAEDGKQAFASVQKLMQSGMRGLPNGGRSLNP